MALRPQPGLDRIELYKGGESALAGVNRVIKLSSNENPAGPSPAAVDAYRALSGELALYPSGDHSALRTAIGDVHGLDPERVICGAGSDEIIAFLCQAYAGPGDEVLYSAHGFLMYKISALAAGADPVTAPETDRCADVDALLGAVTDRTRLVFLANPNNPTGTLLPSGEVTRLADGLPEDCLLVLDGAYAEYLDDPDYWKGMALAGARANVFMTRTFSKIYGLGGLRIGWGYGAAEVVDTLHRVRGPFNVNAPALAAAEAAVRDTAYTETCRAENARLRAALTTGLQGLGLGVDESAGNFVLTRFADEATAVAADEALRAGGIIARRVAGYGLPDAIRITVGDAYGCQAVLRVLTGFMKGRGS